MQCALLLLVLGSRSGCGLSNHFTWDEEWQFDCDGQTERHRRRNHIRAVHAMQLSSPTNNDSIHFYFVGWKWDTGRDWDGEKNEKGKRIELRRNVCVCVFVHPLTLSGARSFWQIIFHERSHSPVFHCAFTLHQRVPHSFSGCKEESSEKMKIKNSNLLS